MATADHDQGFKAQTGDEHIERTADECAALAVPGECSMVHTYARLRFRSLWPRWLYPRRVRAGGGGSVGAAPVFWNDPRSVKRITTDTADKPEV